MTTELTAKSLTEAVDGTGENGYSIVYYEPREPVSWAEKDGTITNFWFAKKDENDYPIIVRVETHSPDDEDFDEDSAHEAVDEFHYEGGYVHPFGMFKMIDNGNLGDGHEAWVLVEHQESGRLFRREGCYSSWGDSGMEDDFVEVVPAEVTVVRYKSLEDGKIFENPAVTVKD